MIIRDKKNWFRTLVRISPMIVLVLIVIVYAFGGCVPAEGNYATSSSSDARVNRYIDREYSVVCYYREAGGIDCIPLSDLE